MLPWVGMGETWESERRSSSPRALRRSRSLTQDLVHHQWISGVVLGVGARALLMWSCSLRTGNYWWGAWPWGGARGRQWKSSIGWEDVLDRKHCISQRDISRRCAARARVGWRSCRSQRARWRCRSESYGAAVHGCGLVTKGWAGNY